ncbi:hypothetical protein COCOBI_06-5810 [Coccomyxa sp. Obi]|nr:hypothetical protein COCOBI_06-5810 [Coccomyxa sp. Obi]
MKISESNNRRQGCLACVPLCLFWLAAISQIGGSQADCRALSLSDIAFGTVPVCNRSTFPTNNGFYSLPAESVWDVVASMRSAQPLQEVAAAAFVAYLSKTNPWSLSMRELLSCLPRFFRREDLVFLEVSFEDMTYTEQMHHRLGALPAFKVYTAGRRYTMEGQQSFAALVSFISTKTGAKPVLSAADFREALNSTLLPCSTQLSPVTPEDFGHAGRNWWLVLSAAVVVALGAHYKAEKRLQFVWTWMPLLILLQLALRLWHTSRLPARANFCCVVSRPSAVSIRAHHL